MSNEKQEQADDIVREMRQAQFLNIGQTTNYKPGNAAAMREALVLARERIVETKSYYDADADKEDCEALLAAIDAALSTSPRNCDVYRTKKDAEDAFLATKCDHPCGNCTVSDDFGCALVHECGVDWLLAPATDRKGETDESK